jgi:hypothetical protein
MRNCLITVLILFLLVIPSLSAQMADRVDIGTMKQDYLGFKPAEKPFSLLDLSRLHWSHSYSLNFFSGGGTSGTTGLYTASVLYEFSSRLSLNLKLGIAHDPSSLFERNAGRDATLLPGLHLNYHPSPNFSISAGFDTYLGSSYYGYNPYNYRSLYWR